ncbi:cell envelope biogenesis protein AsmA [Jannaschia pagri]|uniref:Cell envelope biogenesis protein AsmA n=1 Tax=Jannaschia pagri TaxID=2829797 RepID=A0ABQ4NI06_9RHOB|nr:MULTISPECIES: AsmA family protein [unclassified Jannaschia]GIT89848.1 cell envelope biogenesis protein AsmA [Jannaschia sp. AI_61]GIT94045.1 cell envelope biogenesis protein AsmA [Jannaschia sp. AI_62]
MRWLFRIVLTLVTLVVVAVVALLLVPTDRVASLAAERFQAATGRSLVIEGPVRATLWPRIGVRAEGIQIANADWSDAGPMVQAEALDIGVSLPSLFGESVVVERLEVTGARLILEKAADGRANWEMSGPASQGSSGLPAGAASRQISIDRAILSGADVQYIDRATGTTTRLRAVDVSASLPDLTGPVTLEWSALMGSVALGGQATIGGLQSLLDGELTSVAGSLTSGATRIEFDGRADVDPLSLQGELSASSSDEFALVQAFGLAAPDVPSGLGADRISVETTLTFAPAGSLHLRGLEVALDQNTLSGGADITFGTDRPKITATLSAPTLDLTGLSREGQGGESALVAESGWGREALDVSGLFAADADITFSSGPITLGDATLDRVSLATTVDRGRAVVTLQPVVAYGGTVTGEVVVNGRGGLSSRANLDLKGLQMQPFLTEFADMDRLIGQADVSLRLLGVGDTMQALMDSLNGSLSVNIGQGELLGLDIPGMIRTLDTSYRGPGQKTIFNGVSASFAVSEGVARGDDLSFQAPLLASTGAGSIDIGAQSLDYRLMPTLRRNADSEGVTVPILITGAWSDPRIRPDLEWLARQELEARAKEEAAKLEARVRQEAEEARARAEAQARSRIAEELEVDPAALGSREAIEDAIKDRVGEQLLDLLGNR